MADVLGVTPGELRGVAGNLDQVMSQMAGSKSTLEGQLADAAAAGAPWGEGSLADQFAPGYLAQLHSVFNKFDIAINTLRYWSEYLTVTANSFQQTDQSNLA